MAVGDFNGDTFVAFTDISGFKEMMKGDGQKAIRALDKLNRAGFHALQRKPEVNGFFVSDCGILFVKDDTLSKNAKLSVMLEVIQNINRTLLNEDIMLTTSIAYGNFSYHSRIEFDGIEKNPIYGNAYVAAFLDNETGKPKMQPGQCRIVLGQDDNSLVSVNDRLVATTKHLNFYWMVDTFEQIEGFERQYNDSYQLKYRGMLSALKSNG
ncbi:Uncharacterised protein [Plesiomonas shigelloides]|uniref:hypothetical protein n=1 Tax=Plesiomonas shigelloides TaxID=703 RepID=UPI000E07C75B|nr:hypothetical protein [Plesiomonas shigelloides]SUB63521.1 Uncharacterised protein [Plesiomonas shigelloides]